MKCPVCGNSLVAQHIGRVELDVCSHGCGGIWCDSGEFAHIDDEHEYVTANLLRSAGAQNVLIDRAKPRNCPKCEDEVLNRAIYDEKNDIEIDGCPSCQGIWLDTGELETLRQENTERKNRREAYKAFCDSHEAAFKSGKVPERIRAIVGLLFR